mmetsp:Transcript_34079/g.119126  ORF Transcript_34079/g.119126 Transcript_34079/m.119126 type:complete len:291 (-) Transcript_34079:284-1156(-)
MARAPSASRVMRIARRTVSASQRVRSVRRNDAGVRPQAPRRFISSCALFEDARTFEVRRTNVRTGASRDASRDAPSCTRLARVPTAAVSVGAAVLAASREAACRFVGAASRGRRRGAVPRLGAEACGPRRAVSLLQRRRRQVVANRPIVANRRRRPVVVVAVVVVVEMPRRRVEQRGSVVLGVDSCVWRHRRDKVVSRRKCNKAVRRGERHKVSAVVAADLAVGVDPAVRRGLADVDASAVGRNVRADAGLLVARVPAGRRRARAHRAVLREDVASTRRRGTLRAHGLVR